MTIWASQDGQKVLAIQCGSKLYKFSSMGQPAIDAQSGAMPPGW